uniref:HNH endonuclease n=1 Tax=Herbidospora sakaeratensis TaxID=564415 RepID=UPI001C3F3D80|nr:HNH endonuclease [Herbidospora sakaeratensis]
MREIRAHLQETLGEAPSQTDRRVRDLRDHFTIPAKRISGEYRYVLEGWTTSRTNGSRKSISGAVRAQVLSPQRCAMCGRTPLDHQVTMVVDHKLPRHWGGSDEIGNLQPLCEECNSGKKAYFANYEQFDEAIRQAAGHPEPHGRIGELMKAFAGDWVPAELIEIVASIRQYQEDWRKRTRELRLLGWVLETEKRKEAETGRIRVRYRVTSWEPWPQGSIAAEVRRRDPSNNRAPAPER